MVALQIKINIYMFKLLKIFKKPKNNKHFTLLTNEGFMCIPLQEIMYMNWKASNVDIQFKLIIKLKNTEIIEYINQLNIIMGLVDEYQEYLNEK